MVVISNNNYDQGKMQNMFYWKLEIDNLITYNENLSQFLLRMCVTCLKAELSFNATCLNDDYYTHFIFIQLIIFLFKIAKHIPDS